MGLSAEDVRISSGVDLTQCIQCGTCTEVCPVAAHMEPPPSRAIDAIVSGRAEGLLIANTSWLCTSCLACTTHCPKGIDFARVLDDLRHRVLSEGLPPGDRRIAQYHREFTARVRERGRFFVRLADLFDNFERGLALLFRGRWSLFATKARDRSAVDDAFSETEKRPER